MQLKNLLLYICHVTQFWSEWRLCRDVAKTTWLKTCTFPHGATAFRTDSFSCLYGMWLTKQIGVFCHWVMWPNKRRNSYWACEVVGGVINYGTGIGWLSLRMHWLCRCVETSAFSGSFGNWSACSQFLTAAVRIRFWSGLKGWLTVFQNTLIKREIMKLVSEHLRLRYYFHVSRFQRRLMRHLTTHLPWKVSSRILDMYQKGSQVHNDKASRALHPLPTRVFLIDLVKKVRKEMDSCWRSFELRHKQNISHCTGCERRVFI
jgi:hypothetical protein